MRIGLLVALALIGSVVPLERLAFGAEPKGVIEKAILAHGGQERIAKLRVIRAQAKGTVNLGAEVPFSWETVWQWPNQYKVAAVLEAPTAKVTLIQGFDGASGWVSAEGATAALEGKKLAEFKAQMHVRRVLTLAPLLSDRDYELSELDDVMIEGQPSAGVLVTAQGQRDVKLYFAKETGLLSKIERLVLDDATMREVPQEDLLSDYHEIDGVKTAKKEVWVRSGTKVAQMEYTTVSYPNKIEAQEFKRPAAGLPADLPYTRTADVIYGRKFGTALTMDVFRPREGANGAAVILVVSGGWVSDNQALSNALIGHFVAVPVRRGYTVFAVVHGSQPKFTIPEAVADLNRAVRYIRHHAQEYQIDPDRIGITGGSAGGHLSLMQGTAGDQGNAKSADLVERESSRVQAVACLFPPTDFLNYGDQGKYAFSPDGLLAAFRPVVDVRELDPQTLRLERSADERKQLELARTISPISHVSADDPPTLIVHGDADKLVPIGQAQAIVAKFKAAGVKAELLTREGRGHDFAGIDKDIAAMIDWFDEHLPRQ